MKMNTYKDLQNLSKRAGALHEKINGRIHQEEMHFCRQCGEHGRYCGIAQLTMEDKEKLIAIRDSLKDFQDILEFFQKLESRQQRHYNGALIRLEESRMVLIERLNKYPNCGMKLDVIEELRECFGKEKEKEKEIIEEQNEKRNSSSFVTICIRIAAVALIVVSASISSPVKFYKNRQLQGKTKMDVTRMKIDYSYLDCPLAVSFGKG